MSKSLWDFYDGEPFMENPPLGLLGVNSPHRKAGKKMATRRRKRAMPAGLKRYWATHRRSAGRKRAPARKRRTARRRKNWVSPGLVVAANPRRRRSSARRRNPVHHRRHRRHHNPAFLGLSIPPLKSVLFGGIGFAGPSLVSGFVTSMAPTVMQTVTSWGMAGKYAIKVGSVLGLSWLTRRFVGVQESNMVLIGGGINVAMTLVNDFVPGILPANPLAMYIPTRQGMQSYVPVRAQLRGAVAGPSVIRQIPTLRTGRSDQR